MMNYHQENNEGFTLAEVLVAFTILLIPWACYLILHRAENLPAYRRKIDIQQTCGSV